MSLRRLQQMRMSARRPNPFRDYTIINTTIIATLAKNFMEFNISLNRVEVVDTNGALVVNDTHPQFAIDGAGLNDCKDFDCHVNALF
jgi:hypothetical protein